MTDHRFGSPDCWCDPDVQQLCPVCEPDPGESDGHETMEEAVATIKKAADPSCWRCGGEGLIEEEPDPWQAQEGGLLIIHNAGG